MLKSIHIENVALIESLSLDFFEGLNVLSGETGAGKSILIDAVSLVLGERADKELIRQGADKAVVEAYFSLEDTSVVELLLKWGVELDTEELILTREVHLSGRNIARINGVLLNNQALKQVSTHLVDIHGQHEHQSLFDATNHLRLLDAYVGQELLDTVKQYAEQRKKLGEIRAQLAGLGASDGERERRMDMIRFSVAEIQNEHLSVKEEEELEENHRSITGGERVQEGLSRACEALYGEESSGAMTLLEESIASLRDIEEYYPSAKEEATKLEELYYGLEAVMETVRSWKNQFYFDPDALQQVEQRLRELQRIKRKYGGSIASALDYLKEAEDELYQLEHAEDVIRQLAEQEDTCTTEMYRLAEKMHLIRQQNAEVFQKEVFTQLTDLGMEHGAFVASFDSFPTLEEAKRELHIFGVAGLDRMEFFFSANKGQEPRPLSRIASGGEASRIMLALKHIFARLDHVGCLIFDEIDTGISGRMAHVVAEKMSHIAKERQVLCVSHLAQLAAMADYNYLIEKREEKERVLTLVYPLNPEERIQEVARLAGGREGDMAAISHANTLLLRAKEWKEMIRTETSYT